ILIEMFKRCLGRFGIDDHCAELVDPEDAASETITLLQKEHRTGARALDKNGYNKKHRRTENQAKERAHDVDSSFNAMTVVVLNHLENDFAVVVAFPIAAATARSIEEEVIAILHLDTY